MIKRIVRAALIVASPMWGACDITDVSMSGDLADTFVEAMDVQSFQSLVVSGAAQVEVVLLPGGLTARELAVRPSRASGEERVQSRAVAVAGDALGGRVTLMLGGLEIGYDQQTRFWLGEHEVDREAFLAELRADLDAGFEPPVVAERPVPASPQDPTDASFLAAALALTGDGEGRLRVEVDADNLELVANPQPIEPDGWLAVLGLRIQLRVADGTTAIESHEHDFEHVETFEGLLASVRPDAGTVTLADGTVVRVVDQTRIAVDEGLIGTLVGVAEALEAGSEVVAWGKGAVESEDPLVLVGLSVAFKARGAEDAHLVEFEGFVAVVRVDAGSFELADGTVIRLSEGTEVVAYDDHSPSSLAGVAEALEAGAEVVSWGKGEVVGEEPLTLDAVRVVFKARQPEQPGAEFEGRVARVELNAHAVYLEDGTKIVAGEGTEVVAFHDASPHDLTGLAEALERGRIVSAWGHGTVESESPIVIGAKRIVLRVAIEDFERDVEQVDADAGTLVIEGGWLLRTTGETELTAADDASPSTLAGAADALAAGDRVRVWGWGFVTSREPVELELARLTIRRIPAG